jgi:hypothetical protein
MLVFRWAILLLLLASAVLFGLFATTGQARYKRWGLITLMWTLIAAFGFFGVLIVDRLGD